MPYNKAHTWFKSLGWKVAPFQKEAWQAYADGNVSMLTNGVSMAPYNYGKMMYTSYDSTGGKICDSLVTDKPILGK